MIHSEWILCSSIRSWRWWFQFSRIFFNDFLNSVTLSSSRVIFVFWELYNKINRVSPTFSISVKVASTFLKIAAIFVIIVWYFSIILRIFNFPLRKIALVKSHPENAWANKIVFFILKYCFCKLLEEKTFFAILPDPCFKK